MGRTGQRISGCKVSEDLYIRLITLWLIRARIAVKGALRHTGSLAIAKY